MYTEFDFKSEISRYLTGGFNNDQHKRACWLVYQNAYHAKNNRLVAGLLDDLKIALASLGKTSLHERGSVLRASPWSIVLNDAWVLGGIHGYINFELVSSLEEGSILDSRYTPDQPKDRMFRVTGRELIGLTTFGYAQVYGPVERISHDINPQRSTRSNALIQCVNKSLAKSATFTRYQQAIQDKAGEVAVKGWKIANGLVYGP